MRSRRSAANCDEFPMMTELGLYASKIIGDGDCMFSALSDQFYGSPNRAAEIRLKVCDHVENNVDLFKPFVTVTPSRRNPKRKGVSVYSTPYDEQKPTEQEIDRVFYERLHEMRQGGTWGDNVEVQAFANVYKCIVKIWKTAGSYEITPFADQGKQNAVEDAVHLAYHDWQHYSSVRRLDGPHTGRPGISFNHLTKVTREAVLKKQHVAPSHPEDWQIDLVQKSIPFFSNKAEVIKHLTENNCDVDLAVASLMHEQESREQSSAQESSSIERDHDSDDDEFIHGPNKRRTTKSISRERSEPPPSTAPSTTPPSSVDGRPMLPAKSRVKRVNSPTQSQQSSRESTAGSEARPSQEQMAFMRRRIVTDDSDDDFKPRSDSTASAPSSPKKPVRLRLTMPKPPKDFYEADDATSKSSQQQTGSQSKKKSTSARDKKDFRKQAQKAARRERQQQTVAENSAPAAVAETPAPTAVTERSASMTAERESKLPIIPKVPTSDVSTSDETGPYQRRRKEIIVL
ncbi:hypothetical protein HDK77DRAFT_67708 [Phyllosticta capitalensis]